MKNTDTTQRNGANVLWSAETAREAERFILISFLLSLEMCLLSTDSVVTNFLVNILLILILTCRFLAWYWWATVAFVTLPWKYAGGTRKFPLRRKIVFAARVPVGKSTAGRKFNIFYYLRKNLNIYIQCLLNYKTIANVNSTKSCLFN